MITLRRGKDRLHVHQVGHDIWLTFDAKGRPGTEADPFAALAGFSEILLPPGGGTPPHPCDEAEIVTYQFEGTIAHEDSAGGSGVIQAGEFQRMTTGRGTRQRETNASRTHWARIFHVSLRPAVAGLGCSHEHGRFASAQRRNVLCVVASPDGRNGSLRLRQDTLVFSSVLDPGRHLIHEILPGRRAWLHVLQGEVMLGDSVLTRGDGAGISIEPSVSLTALESTEVLLVDLGPDGGPAGKPGGPTRVKQRGEARSTAGSRPRPPSKVVKR